MHKIQISVTTTDKAKDAATAVTKRLGLSLSTALNMCIRQIALQQRLPYSTALPRNPYFKYGRPTTDNELRNRIKQTKKLQNKDTDFISQCSFLF